MITAAANGLHRFEMLGSDEPWLALLPRDVMPCLQLVSIPVAAGGAAAFAHRGARAAWHGLKRPRSG